jgi:periplasmic copper chaperone A
MKSAVFTALAAVASFIAVDAAAHVTLEQKTAIAGSTGKIVLRVPHGCEGSPTTAISVFIPEGFNEAKPMPKAGWTLEIQKAPLAKPYDSHGTPITERVARITWSGGRLQESEYDEFIVRATMPEAAGKQYLRVLQTCEKGSTDWADLPAADKPRSPTPALELEITPAGMQMPHHQH